MFDSVLSYLDKFGPELLVIQFGFLIILSTLFMWLWFANRRKYHNLKHAIPANVVKSYLDSIIQNSTALKSSLTRGGAQDLNGIPSVMPLSGLTGGESVGIDGSKLTALQEEINQKRALIASLESQIQTSQSALSEFEAKLRFSEGQLGSAQTRIRELEEILARVEQDGQDEILKSELENTTKERDEALEKLREFEIIADDLANLKRLQQENEQLKRSLSAGNKDDKKADVSELLENINQNESPAPSDDDLLENFLSSPDEDELIEAAVAAEESSEEVLETKEEAKEEIKEENKPKAEKTPEDLLSEFEKMLG